MSAKERYFAYQIKHALDENTERLSSNTMERLASARKIAVSRKKKSFAYFFIRRPAMAGQKRGFFNQPLTLLGRLGVAAPLLAGALLFIGLYQFEQEQRLYEMAEIDVAVLSDDLPISAYVDKGFNAYLAGREE